jgi:hypothetical protein
MKRMTQERPEDLIAASQARELIGVSTVKMAKLLREGRLRYVVNPLDHREKLVSRAAVLALAAMRKEAA